MLLQQPVAAVLAGCGFNGLTDAEEQEFYKSAYLDQIQGKVNQAVFDSIFADPARDDYHYFRGSDWDQMRAPILQRYKYINNPQATRLIAIAVLRVMIHLISLPLMWKISIRIIR